MNDSPIITQIIIAIPGTIAAFAALVAAVKSNKHAGQARDAVVTATTAVAELKDTVNGKMEKLLESVGKENLAVGRAEGVEQERIAERERQG